jgi:hypothetical protein
MVSSHAAHLVIPEYTKKMWKVGGREGCATRRDEDIGWGQRRVADTTKKAACLSARL